jgi:hypothetical protein
MQIRYTLCTILAPAIALAAATAFATDSHDYAEGEYAIIREGFAPKKENVAGLA